MERIARHPTEFITPLRARNTYTRPRGFFCPLPLPPKMDYTIHMTSSFKTLSFRLVVALIGAVIVVGGGFYLWKTRNQSPAVPEIAIASPQTGDNWTIGSTHAIAWTTKNIPEENKISLTIRRIPPPPLQTEGQEFDPILFTNLANTGTVDWTIADQYPTGTYVLGISSYASVPVTNPISAQSAPFEITREPLIGGDKDAHGCLVAAGYSWCQSKNKCLRVWEENCPVVQHFPSAVYPLYSGVSWGAEETATDTIPLAGTQATLTGYRITSKAIQNITNIAAVSTPFETYYRQKLQAAGWTINKMLEAGGPGSSISGYTKGSDYLIISYATVFHAGGVNEPVQCPCDTTLSIFYGTRP